MSFCIIDHFTNKILGKINADAIKSLSNDVNITLHTLQNLLLMPTRKCGYNSGFITCASNLHQHEFINRPNAKFSGLISFA